MDNSLHNKVTLVCDVQEEMGYEVADGAGPWAARPPSFVLT
jgi:hypothetical protein